MTVPLLWTIIWTMCLVGIWFKRSAVESLTDSVTDLIKLLNLDFNPYLFCTTITGDTNNRYFVFLAL